MHTLNLPDAQFPGFRLYCSPDGQGNYNLGAYGPAAGASVSLTPESARELRDSLTGWIEGKEVGQCA